MPLRSSRANPPTACCALGCACRDSGSSAANTFIKKGSVSPKRPRAVAPSCPFGSAAQGVQQKLVALVGHLPGGDRQGACPATAQLPGCAVGLGPPVDSTSAVREPMHRSVPLRVAGALDLTSNQSQVHGRHLQPHGQQRQLLLRAAGPQTGACGVIGPSEISGTSSSPPITSTWLRPVSRATTTDRSAVGSTKVRTRCGSALVT
jgi:hypothetical protein